jgi:transposase
LPEAYIAPPDLRELRELVRHRRQLVKLATAVKAGVRALLAKHNIRLAASDLDGDTATGLLDALALPGTYATRLASQRRLLLVLADEIAAIEVELHGRLRHHPGYCNLLKVKGIGPILAAVFVAEIGEVTRLPTSGALCCWAGLTPRHRESDTSVHRGPITKQGSKLVRWAAIEACQRTRPGTKLAVDRTRIITARGRNIGVVAAARRLLTLVYYGLRDGEIRTLAARAG